MTKQEFCAQYIERSAERAMALSTLPDDGDRSLMEWRNLWTRILNSPAH